MKTGINYHKELPVAGISEDLFFGVVISGFFLILSLAPLMRGDGIRPWLMYISIGLLLASFLFPRAFTPFRKLWLRFGLLSQKILQPLILGIVFYGMFTPIGVVMRFFGKDPLRLKKTSGSASYWKLRALNQVDADMKNQF